ncbi:protein phosphatase [Alteribacillus persepolensis]|uniref:Protein phosphatase n=1 Tax=Alteribacillus persepolensis TaxID=568899 RepID=A0A1G8EQW7_9BACI|nr:bis(5'-nucleosyl)-tetraphosphatase PrpE [Alteribacillus persepolensis]SDH72129.1 protein phosphatase [Alteribacillus persepolensis]
MTAAYDFIGDIHGCFDELTTLLKDIGYHKDQSIYTHPSGRIPVFIGDLTDRGPKSVAVMELVSKMVAQKAAYYVPGNHCDKLYRYFLGRNVQIKHGLETTVAELEALPNRKYKKIRHAFMELYDHAPWYQHLDHDQVIAAHAGIRSDLIGKQNKAVKTFVLYGDITGEKHSDGTPVRRDWALHYNGKRTIVYGHTPVHEPRIKNNTINIDTGCVFGGKLTALHYPEMTFSDTPSAMPFVKEKFRTFDDEHTQKDTKKEG